MRCIAASLEQVAFGNDDHVAFAKGDHRLDRPAPLDGVEVEEENSLLPGGRIGAAQLDALDRREAVAAPRERYRLQERGAGLDLDLAGQLTSPRT